MLPFWNNQCGETAVTYVTSSKCDVLCIEENTIYFPWTKKTVQNHLCFGKKT